VVGQKHEREALPFCTLPHERLRAEDQHAVWIRDGYPASPGHSPVIPKRHVGSFFGLSAQERMALLEMGASTAASASTKPMSTTLCRSRSMGGTLQNTLS
jgi:diadenosine tetraphosphate (Ap4A) HIT family hydrolase